MKSIAVFCILFLLTAPNPAQSPLHLRSGINPMSKSASIFERPSPLKYSGSNCNSLASILSVLAAPCNGVSVTSVVFSAATRTVESGITNTVGVIYRYPNVGTAPDGTVLDALVTVVSYNNNQDADQTTFRDADLAGPPPPANPGFENNLQPSLNQEANNFIVAAPWTGNITYRIQFVVNGTSMSRVITIAATTLDNDGSTACGGLNESVSFSAGFNQILINATTPAPGTNQVLSGNTVTGPTTTQANIGTGSNFSSSALYVNVSEFNWTQGFTTAGNCTVGGASEVRYGSLNLSCQIPFNRNFASTTLSGTVFNDTNGLTDSTVNGTGTNAGGLFANLLDSNGNVVSSVAVAADGTYSFPTALAGTYGVQISTVQGVESSAAPAGTLPAGWVSTGENLGAGAGSDGTVNGRLPVTVAAVAITNVNFGIEQRPVANNNTAVTQINPGGTISLIVPPTTFTATDTAPGTVSSIRITTFPNGITSITINGVQYIAATFPVGGVIVPTNAAGNPTQVISVDPFDGNRTINIPYVAIDNAGVESSVAGIATLPVSAGTTAADASISGRVLNDQGRGAAHTIVLISDQNGNIRNALTNSFGYYRFDNLRAGEIYVINIRHKRLSYQQRTISLTEDFTDVDFLPQP